MTLDDILLDIHALEQDLQSYERKYGVLSETFYESYASGEEDVLRILRQRRRARGRLVGAGLGSLGGSLRDLAAAQAAIPGCHPGCAPADARAL